MLQIDVVTASFSQVVMDLPFLMISFWVTAFKEMQLRLATWRLERRRQVFLFLSPSCHLAQGRSHSISGASNCLTEDPTLQEMLDEVKTNQGHHPTRRSPCGWPAGGVTAMIIPTILGVAQKRQSVSEVPFSVTKDDSTEEDIQGLRADRMDEPCRSGDFCFNSSKISRGVTDNALEMKTVVYLIYRGL